MQEVRLGRSELLVSRVGFGGIPIQRVSEEEAVSVVRGCLDLGVTFIDTANMYTTSEERIGLAIRGRREQVVLATKTLARTAAGVKEHLQLSLRQLDVSYIDLYQFHMVSTEDVYALVTAPGGLLAVVRQAREQGLVRHIGVTCHSLDIARKAVQSGFFETVMLPFNFISSEPADQVLPLARQHDVGFIAMKPFAGGALKDAALSFKYLLQFPDVVPIPGIEKVPEMEEIVCLVQGDLTISPAERAEMERVKNDLGTRFCRRCDYCRPCPQGIPISSVNTIDIFLRTFAPERVFVGNIADNMAKALECTRCGECEPKCPYNLPIRDMMDEKLSLYEDARRAYMLRAAARKA